MKGLKIFLLMLWVAEFTSSIWALSRWWWVEAMFIPVIIATVIQGIVFIILSGCYLIDHWNK